MKKTINISLGGQSFTIEEDAYNRLDIYLIEVRENFADYPESDEIVSDIEARIAERFDSKIKNRVVNLDDVEELIAVMGQPEDFEEGAKTEKSNKKAKKEEEGASLVTTKKLFRNPDDVIVAGVCSGISAYFGIDTLWVRLAFFISIFFGGLGIIVYIAFWILVPEATTETEKMQMRGQSVNLKNLEATIRDRVKEFKKKDFSAVKSGFAAIPRKIASFVEVLVRILKKVILVCLKIFGLFIVVGAAAGIMFAVFVLINLLFNDLFSFVYVFNPALPLREVIDANAFTILAVSGFFTAFAVFTLMVLVGMSLVSLKNKFTYFSFFTLLGVWIVAVSTFVVTAMGVAPKIHDAINKMEAVEYQEQTIDVAEFNALEVEGHYLVEVYSADKYEVKVQAPEVWDPENIEVDNGVLKLDTWNGEFFDTKDEEGNLRLCLFCEHQPVKVKIYTPDVEMIDLQRGARLTMLDFELDSLEVNLRNATKADFDLNVGELKMQTFGIAEATLDGEVESFILNAYDASLVHAQEANFEKVTVNTEGIAKAHFDEAVEVQEVENIE